MKSFLSCSLLLFLIIFSKESRAQIQDVRFNLVAGGDGISFGKINALLKDKYGFLWLSDQSNGCLIRYDGNQLTRYKNILKNPNSLGGTYPECLATDTSGVLWIGFYGMGVDRFDPSSNTFTHYRHDPNDPQSLSHDLVSAILVDHLGNVWVGNDGGLDLLDQKTGKFRHFSSKPGDSTSLSDNLVRAIYEDKSGELWIGTGYPWMTENDGGLNHFHRSSGTFTRHLNDPKNPSSLIDNKVRAIFEDSKGNFWIGTRGDGLHLMDRKTGLITRLTYDPAKPGQLSRPPVIDLQDHITFITEDITHQIWIGTHSNGVVRYDPDTKKTVHYTNYITSSANQKDNSSWCALATADGLVWLSTQNANLYKIELYNSMPSHFGDSEKDAAHIFCAESASVLWWGTSAGLIRKDLKDGTMRHFVHDPNDPNSLSSNNITALIRDKRGDLWIGTSMGGLDRYNLATNTFRHYGHLLNTIPQTSINVLCEAFDSTIWIGTNGKGLNHLDPSPGKNIQYALTIAGDRRESTVGDSSSVFDDFVSTLLEEDSIYLWIGADFSNGIYRMDRRTQSFKFYLAGVRIFCSYKDKNGTLWMGTEGGLYKYDKESDNFLNGADINDALNLPNAFSIIEDNKDNLWIASTPGIFKLNPRRDHTTLFGQEYGIAQGNNLYPGYKMEDGELYFGNTSGYYSFYPDKIDAKPSSTQLYLTNFWLNNVEVRSGNNSPLHKSIFETSEILLNYKQNVFAFSFGIVDFRKSNLMVYYKLENYDHEWRTIGTANRAEYYKIPPGKYHLLIKTINSSNGEWMTKTISIIISPPWWKTWWAYSLYALLLILSAIMIHRYQKERLLKRERERSRVIELKQAKEIEKAYQELKRTQSQLIHSEKMASLGELTAGIAHEIQNPLNFINNFSEVNTELIDEMDQELKRGNTNEAMAISKSIKENEAKITHHGKRADAIVKGMLEHSRSSSGQKEPTALNSIVDEYLRLSYHGMRAKENNFNAAIHTEFDPTIGNIDIIRQDIGRVLMNLYNNAFYAISEKKKQTSGNYQPALSVITKKIADKIEIRVEDNGNGIPQKVIDKIFQPFFTTKPTGQGTGLGLSLSYDIIKAHGGEIHVETKEKESTAFIIHLPIKDI